MSRENRGLLINFGILLIVSLGFLLGYNMFYKAQDQKKYQTYFAESTGYKEASIDSSILSEKYEILNGKTIIGYHYIGGDYATGIPGTEGKKEFRLSVIVDSVGKVINVEVDYSEHTESFVEKVLPFLSSLNNTNIVNFLNVDDIGGASAYTMPVVHKVLTAVTKDVLNKEPNEMIPNDPYILVFGEYGSKVADPSFVASEVVISKEIIYSKDNQPIGVAYVGTGVEANIPYHDGPAKIDLLVGFDLSGNVIGTHMLTIEHTPSYAKKMDAQIAALVGTNLADLGFDIVAGATLSSTVVQTIINGIKSVYKAFDLYSLVGLEYETAADDETFTATSIVLEKKVLKDASDNIVGYVLVGSKGTNDIPYHDGEAALKIMVGMDASKVITGIYILENGHTVNYFKKNLDFLNGLTGVNINDYQTVDVVAGATVSLDVIKGILEAMKGVA